MKIAILGAESTGKTELASRLAAHWSAQWVESGGGAWTTEQ